MRKKLLSIVLIVLALVGIAYGQALQPYSFPFTGKWNASENPLLLDEHGLQDIQNLRKDGKRFKGVSGHTAINTVYVSGASNDYPYILNGFHFKKDQPAESHMIVYAADSMTPTDGRLYQNTTAIPEAGDFSPAVLYVPTSFSDVWRFSNAPAGNMVASNGDEMLIWGGNELDATSFITSSADVNLTVTNSNDYTDILNNTRQTADQVATLAASGGNDTYTKLMIHADGTNGSTSLTDSSSTGHAITNSGIVLVDTSHKKFGTASAFFGGTSSYLSIADSADWDICGADDFAIDFWVRFESLHDAAETFVSQYQNDSNRWLFYKAATSDGNKLGFISVSGGATRSEVKMTNDWSGVANNTWYHIAISRSGSSYGMFINGVAQPLTVLTSFAESASVSASMQIGMYNSTIMPLYGSIDEFRLSKGVYRYNPAVTGFTAPTQPYGNGSNYFLIGFKRALQGVKFYVNSGNTLASTMVVKEWQGSSWSELAVTDNTDTAGATLAQTGTITWTYTGNAKPRYINGLSLYWYQFSFDVGSASIYYVTVDAPIQAIRNIWDGIEGYAIKCLKYDGTTYKDYTSDVGDGYASSYADLSSLNTTHALYVGFLEPQQGLDITFVAGSENSTATVLSGYYWNGSDWSQLTATNDGTISGSTSLSKGGCVSWQAPDKGTEFKRSISDEFPLYYYKLTWSVQLDADVKVSEIRGISSPPVLSVFKFSEIFQNRLFLFNEKSGSNNAAIYSNANAPDIFNGDDSGSVVFGGKTELTAAKTIYNVFQNTAVEQMLVTKAHETWRLSGNDPSDWELKRMSANIGCVAPLTMVSAEVTETATDVRRSVAIWVSDNGPVISDGAAIYPIYEDISVYWDPKDARFIPASMQSKSVGWYDPALQSYKLLIASGAGATHLNTELEYSLKYKEWTKVHRENAAGANPLQCGFQVHDVNGLGYTYGGGKDGYLYRLENGNNWNGVANISQYIHTKDLILDNQTPLFRLSTVKYIRTAYKQKACAAEPLSITHYGDRTQTVTGVKGQFAPTAITTVPSTFYNTQSCNLGPFLYHSFKFAQTTDCADGMELTGFGAYFAPLDTIR